MSLLVGPCLVLKASFETAISSSRLTNPRPILLAVPRGLRRRINSFLLLLDNHSFKNMTKNFSKWTLFTIYNFSQIFRLCWQIEILSQVLGSKISGAQILWIRSFIDPGIFVSSTILIDCSFEIAWIIDLIRNRKKSKRTHLIKHFWLQKLVRWFFFISCIHPPFILKFKFEI